MNGMLKFDFRKSMIPIIIGLLLTLSPPAALIHASAASHLPGLAIFHGLPSVKNRTSGQQPP